MGYLATFHPSRDLNPPEILRNGRRHVNSRPVTNSPYGSLCQRPANTTSDIRQFWDPQHTLLAALPRPGTDCNSRRYARPDFPVASILPNGPIPAFSPYATISELARLLGSFNSYLVFLLPASSRELSPSRALRRARPTAMPRRTFALSFWSLPIYLSPKLMDP